LNWPVPDWSGPKPTSLKKGRSNCGSEVRKARPSKRFALSEPTGLPPPVKKWKTLSVE
jgi:hypothetical protein